MIDFIILGFWIKMLSATVNFWILNEITDCYEWRMCRKAMPSSRYIHMHLRMALLWCIRVRLWVMHICVLLHDPCIRIHGNNSGGCIRRIPSVCVCGVVVTCDHMYAGCCARPMCSHTYEQNHFYSNSVFLRNSSLLKPVIFKVIWFYYLWRVEVLAGGRFSHK